MGEPTAAQLANRAMKAPMVALGWQPRAAGYFTYSFDDDWTGVVYVMTSGAGIHGVGTTRIALGLHHNRVEAAVADLVGRSTNYRDRTLGRHLSNLGPPRPYERTVIANNVDAVAVQLTEEFAQFGLPWLNHVVSDRSVALDLSSRISRREVTNLARFVLLGQELGGDEARLNRLLSARHMLASQSSGEARDALVAIFCKLADGSGISLPEPARFERKATELEMYGAMTSSAEAVAHDLRSYGEDEVADWVLKCSDEDLVRIGMVASWVLYNGPTKSDGSSMYYATAIALAGVYIHDSAPRTLKRSRRRSMKEEPARGPQRFPSSAAFAKVAANYPVGDDARAFWSRRSQ